MIRRHEMLWLQTLLCLAAVFAPAAVLLPATWWVVLVCFVVSFAVSRVVLRLIP